MLITLLLCRTYHACLICYAKCALLDSHNIISTEEVELTSDMTSRCRIFYTSRIHPDTPLFSQPTQQVLPMPSTQPYGGCNLISRNISHYLILWAKARMLCFRVIKGHATTSAPIRDQPRPTIPAKDWGSLGLRIHRLLHGVVIQTPASDHFGDMSVYGPLPARIPAGRPAQA